MTFSEDPTSENIRIYIKKELKGEKVPQIRTIEKWLKDYGKLGVKTRIEEHISYWKEEIASGSPTSDEILDALVELIRKKLKE